MECHAPQDRHPRMDPLRRPRHHGRRQRRPEEPRAGCFRQRRVQARLDDHRRRRLRQHGRRARARAGQGLDQGRFSRGHRRRQGRGEPPRQAQGRQRHPEPARRAVPREHGLQGRPLGPRDLLAARQGRDRCRTWRSSSRWSRPRWPRSPRSRRRIPSCSCRSTATRRSSAPSAPRSGPTRRSQHAVLHGRHAGPPPAHVRRRRRGRRPAAAGRQLVRGDHRPARPGQPAHPAAPCRRSR